MKGEISASIEVAPGDLGESLAAMRLCNPSAQQQMQLSLSKLGQLTPVQVFRVHKGLELIDGFKRVRAARDLSWPRLRAEIQLLDDAGAKVRLWQCNAGSGLSDLEEAWLIRSLYRDDALSQPQIAVLMCRHKSWVCRRLTLAEGLSDELTANVRLGLVSARSAVELGRLPRGNQDAATQVVVRRGLTTRQTAKLVDALLAAPESDWEQVLELVPQAPPRLSKGGVLRRTPAEQLAADVWAIKRPLARLHARLLERSLESLGQEACVTVAHELADLRSALHAIGETIELRLTAHGDTHAC